MIWYCDPGHAWLKVKITRLLKLGIAHKITKYSYMRGEYAYLEEDQDAYTFAHAAKIDLRHIKHTHTNRESRIRSYKSYNIEAIK